mgnify:CR=1 FL=1
MNNIHILDIIEKKRDNKELTKEEIDFVIEGYTNGKIPDYQMSALIMAIYLNGMNSEETTNMTLAMANSGEVLDLSEFNKIFVDKHSTGGVGDKVSLILLPLVASLGVPVAKMSGRGLGITGGTIDKLESIPGYNTNVSEDKFMENGIMITISNNKKKSLMKSKIILNIDFPNELINKYMIKDDAIIINVPGKAKINRKRFNGLMVNNYEIDFRDDIKSEENLLGDEFYLRDVYESRLYKKQTFSDIRNILKKSLYMLY